METTMKMSNMFVGPVEYSAIRVEGVKEFRYTIQYKVLLHNILELGLVIVTGNQLFVGATKMNGHRQHRSIVTSLGDI
jgi:hypothetical protein